MCYAYADFSKRKFLYVIPPFNLVVWFVFWLNLKWARLAEAESWIDKQIAAGLEESRKEFYHPRIGREF